MLTWGTVLDRLRRTIKDVVRESVDPKFSTADLADFWIVGQHELAVYVSRQTTLTIPSGLTTFALPDDFYRVMWVRLDTTSDARHMLALDSLAYEDGVNDATWEGTYYYLTDTHINFTQEPDYTVTVAYRAYYPEPEDPDDRTQAIYIPRWAVPAVNYYATAQALERKMVDDSNLRRWASKAIDSGTPIHNPFTPLAKYFHQRFREVVFNHIGDESERASWPSSYPT